MELLADLLARITGPIMAAMHTPLGLLGLVFGVTGCAMVVAGSFVKTMIPLRWLAVGSNIGFAVYGATQSLVVPFVLSLLLLPINIWRAVQMKQLTRRVSQVATSDETLGIWLKPYMKTHRMKAGEVLFRRGDVADQMYFLADGHIELVEIGQQMAPGRIFGEIALFSPDRRRTQTARCADDCVVLAIDEDTVRQLYYQNPKFGFELIGLLAGRLTADVNRLQSALEAARAEAPTTSRSRATDG